MQASLIINSTEAIIQMYARAVYSVVWSQWVTDIKAGHSPRGGGRVQWRRRDH